MSSMWRVAVIMPAAAGHRAFELGPICRAGAIWLRSRPTPRQRRSLARPLAHASADQRLPLRRLCALPDRQSRLAGRIAHARLGGKGDAARARTPATVLAFFAADKPKSGNGWARLADAYAASGQMAQALDAARQAWRSADLSATDEQAIWARYGGSFTARRQRRPRRCLAVRQEAGRRGALHSLRPARNGRPPSLHGSRCSGTPPTRTAAMQAVIGSVTRDAGLMMDRARWLRANNYGARRRSNSPPATTSSSTGPPTPSASTTC